MGKPLIVTKCLIPGRRSDLLRRPRLIEFIHEHIDRKLVLVCAPAGYGKTSLLIEFAHDVDLPVCWYSVDRADRDLRIFVEYLLAALRQRFPQFGRRVQDLLSSSDLLNDHEALAGVLVNEIYEDIPDYFVLVLDDYHHVDSSEPVNYFVDLLLQRLPENCHLILSSRTIPTLTPRGLALLTARQEVAGLGVRELRFTPQEIQELVLQNQQQALPDDVAQELARQSEGWITGILLSTQATWKDLLAGATRARGTGTGVYDYLAREVFAQQAPEVQRFLLGSAILDEMSAARCDTLLEINHSARILAQLEEGSVFIVRLEKDAERWYRYHALFQGFLKEKLAAEQPDWALALHHRAAGILEAEGDWDASFRHRMAAADAPGAVRLVQAAYREMRERGRFETLAQWIDHLPEEAVARVPQLLLIRGQVYVESSAYADALRLFERAQQGFEAEGDAEGAVQTLADRVMSLRLLGRMREAIECSHEALVRLEEGGRPPAKLAAGVHRNLGICLCQVGELAAGIEELRTALDLNREAGATFGLAAVHGDLSVALSLAGNLAASEFHNEEALRYWEQIGHPVNIANALNSLAVGQQIRGDYERALATFERALESAQRGGSRRLSAFIWAGKGDVYREMARWAEAMDAYNESWRLAESLREPSLSCYLLNATAEVHRARAEYSQALSLARRAYEQATEHGLAQDAARYEMTLAVVFLEQGNASLALEYLQRAEETFTRAQARRELAMACLQLARVAEARGDRSAAMEHVRRMVEVAMELGYDHFLVQEATRALPVIVAAAEANVGGDVLASLERRARDRAAPHQPVSQVSEPRQLRLRILGLGDCAVLVDGEPVSTTNWGAAKARELFFYLLCSPARRKEQIGEVLWPDLSPGRLRSAFHVTLYRVRRALGLSDCVLYENDQYVFNRELDYQFDVEEFEFLVSQAEALRAGDPAGTEERLERATALYKGEFLEGLSYANDEWCFWRREELARKHLEALQTLGDLRLRRERYEGALDAYRKLLTYDGLREDVHQSVMRCLAALGDRNGALRHYQTLVTLLQDELGVAPLEETLHLYEDIAAGGEITER